jgi:hypothetical protein
VYFLFAGVNDGESETTPHEFCLFRELLGQRVWIVVREGWYNCRPECGNHETNHISYGGTFSDVAKVSTGLVPGGNRFVNFAQLFKVTVDTQSSSSSFV